MLTALLLSLAAAILPTIIYVVIFYLADRYEREPLWLVGLAFLWGAAPAIFVSIVGEYLLGARFINAPGSAPAMLLESVVMVPIVEEVTKGLALFAIYWWAYSEFDNVLDGLIYGAMIGFGFAMTENFLYFVGAFAQGGLVQLSMTIFLRALLFGLNHAFYTCLTGIGLGFARTSRNPATRAAYMVTGLFFAIVAHGLHNFGVAITAVSFVNILFSIALAALGLALLIIIIALTWQYEHHCLRTELTGEVGSTLTQQEYQRLVNNRRRPLHRLSKRERSRIQLGAELAMRKYRLRTLGAASEPSLPRQIENIRTQLLNL